MKDNAASILAEHSEFPLAEPEMTRLLMLESNEYLSQ